MIPRECKRLAEVLRYAAREKSLQHGQPSQMRRFYLLWAAERIFQTPSEKLAGGENFQTPSGESPLPWSAYVRPLSVKNTRAREFYETEALRGGWSVRQLDRQINSQFYERIALSKNKAVRFLIQIPR